MIACLPARNLPSFESFLRKSGQDEACLVNLRVIVFAEFFFLLLGPGTQRYANVTFGILAAHHETDLARRVSGNGGVGVLCHREDLFAVLLELDDERQMKPLVLGCYAC